MNKKTLYTGKVTLDNIILLCEKESYFAEQLGAYPKADYYSRCAVYLKELKEKLGE